MPSDPRWIPGKSSSELVFREAGAGQSVSTRGGAGHEMRYAHISATLRTRTLIRKQGSGGLEQRCQADSAFSRCLLRGVHAMSSVLHSAKKRYGKWWLTGFQMTTQRLVMKKEFSGEWSSNHQEEMALEIAQTHPGQMVLWGGMWQPEVLPMPPLPAGSSL